MIALTPARSTRSAACGSKCRSTPAIMILFVLGSLGLPGLSGFVSEFMVFLGAFPYYQVTVAIAVVGVLLTAAYFLRMVQKMFLGSGRRPLRVGLTEINCA